MHSWSQPLKLSISRAFFLYISLLFPESGNNFLPKKFFYRNAVSAFSVLRSLYYLDFISHKYATFLYIFKYSLRNAMLILKNKTKTENIFSAFLRAVHRIVKFSLSTHHVSNCAWTEICVSQFTTEHVSSNLRNYFVMAWADGTLPGRKNSDLIRYSFTGTTFIIFVVLFNHKGPYLPDHGSMITEG